MKPIDWARQHAATMDDAPSLRHMRNFANQRLKANAKIRRQIVEAHGEEAAVKEWDSSFKAEDDEDREAIAMIEKRLEELGLAPAYIVTVNGRHEYEADTEKEVWDIVGRHPMGSLHEVRSPKGLPVDQFIPF